MNLALLDPFRRQIPDRVDATLNLPTSLHFRRKLDKSESSDGQDWKAANHVAFNRRGSYIAVGYGSGTVGVYDVLSRTLSALYRGWTPEGDDDSVSNDDNDNGKNLGITTTGNLVHGVTSVSWSRRSRTLLAGAAGDPEVRLIDATHPFGPEECCHGIVAEETKEIDEERSGSPTMDTTEKPVSQASSFSVPESTQDQFKRPRILGIELLETKEDSDSLRSVHRTGRRPHGTIPESDKKRYPSIVFQFPQPVGSSLQVHPRDISAGIAALNDGSLVAFWAPLSAWEEPDANENGAPPLTVKLVTIFKSTTHFITCAAFDPQGEKIYAATKEGNLLGFEVAPIFNDFAAGSSKISLVKPSFTILIPGGATVWQLLVSRNGRFLVINSADAAIRLYASNECWTTPEEVEKPTCVFQDVVSKVKFASCDVSGDAEFVVGGANGNDDKYELYIWNTSTGALMDKLTGAAVQLYSVSWHPTRSFLAVSASDGLVDIWGPRINWTAFAPDFQALPRNVEYVEREDEFDIDDDDKDDEPKNEEDDEENIDADVVAVEPVPVFASDSEEEEGVFFFQTKITRRLGTFTT
jgi:WD40 repeat protein